MLDQTWIKKCLTAAAAITLIGVVGQPAFADQPVYAEKYDNLHMERSENGVLLVEFNNDGGAFTFTGQDHTDFVQAFYEIGQDRENKIVILTGAGGDWMANIDVMSFGNVADPMTWSHVIDEGTQVLENMANIRVPMICAVEGRAWVHSELCLMSNTIVAGEGASFGDTPHFKGGIVPGDGIYTTWSYYAGPGRAQAFLLNPEPISASTAYDWGVVAEVVPDGETLSRAYELAEIYMQAPELTRRNTRMHFVQPLKELLVKRVGFGLSLEGASVTALALKMQADAK